MITDLWSGLKKIAREYRDDARFEGAITPPRNELCIPASVAAERARSRCRRADDCFRVGDLLFGDRLDDAVRPMLGAKRLLPRNRVADLDGGRKSRGRLNRMKRAYRLM